MCRLSHTVQHHTSRFIFPPFRIAFASRFFLLCPFYLIEILWFAGVSRLSCKQFARLLLIRNPERGHSSHDVWTCLPHCDLKSHSPAPTSP
ncbi:hypothetical protein PHLGIDRAFT_184034 [Phlebiopsis gigantea 11061_1 CR5-6]|uniref:Uncharacterized protein n=1 Tax=Phlebiopsis gigantea (strain 11061_1 CR5-6) TaxID=745531 RepID=A0A0C3S4U4_PHLG1|nr:hypothetical protein PHLGIDRAFT_184034 [Phlebiopsis gigantea 11061_1 CR5-6]